MMWVVGISCFIEYVVALLHFVFIRCFRNIIQRDVQLDLSNCHQTEVDVCQVSFEDIEIWVDVVDKLIITELIFRTQCSVYFHFILCLKILLV